MSRPLVSFCIPTYNRSRYLSSLLDTLARSCRAFPTPTRSSSPTTPRPTTRRRGGARLRRPAADPLPAPRAQHRRLPELAVRDVAGARAATSSTCPTTTASSATQVADTIAKMEADPEIVVVYAPWLLYDLVAQTAAGPVLPGAARPAHRARRARRAARPHPAPPHLPRGADRAPRRAAAPEPRINEHAFFAFVHAADYLTQGAVLIQQHAVLRRHHQLLRRRDARTARQPGGRDRLGPLPRRARIPAGARRQQHRRRGARRLAGAHPADDRGAHVGGDPAAPPGPAQPDRHPHAGDAPARHGLRSAAARCRWTCWPRRRCCTSCCTTRSCTAACGRCSASATSMPECTRLPAEALAAAGGDAWPPCPRWTALSDTLVFVGETAPRRRRRRRGRAAQRARRARARPAAALRALSRAAARSGLQSRKSSRPRAAPA